MVYKFFDKKTGAGAIAKSKTGLSVNEELAQELHKPVIKTLKEEKLMLGLKIISGQQIELKWDHYLPGIEVLNV